MKERCFSANEIDALIPRLEIIMEGLQRCGGAFRAVLEELADATGRPPDSFSTADLLELRPALRTVVDDMRSLLDEIEGYGGEFKGLDLGLIDFPGEVDGEPVLLCWQYGEKAVGFYHARDAGFAGRKPLADATPPVKFLQ